MATRKSIAVPAAQPVLHNMLFHSCVALFFSCAPAFADSVANFNLLFSSSGPNGPSYSLTADLTLISSGPPPPFTTSRYQLTDVQFTLNGVTSAGADVPLTVANAILDHDQPMVLTPVYTFGTGGQCPPFFPAPGQCPPPNTSLDGNFVQSAGNFQAGVLTAIVDPRLGYLEEPILGGQEVPGAVAIWMSAPEPSTWALLCIGLLPAFFMFRRKRD